MKLDNVLKNHLPETFTSYGLRTTYNALYNTNYNSSYDFKNALKALLKTGIIKKNSRNTYSLC